MSTSFERRVDARFVLSVIACGIMSFSGVVVETAMNITFPTLMVDANRRFALSVCYIVLFQAIVLGLGYLIPYYAQVVGDLNEFSAGCLLLPGCLIGVFAGKAKGER